MIRDQLRVGLERPESGAKCCVALFDGLVEPIVGGSLLGQFPDAFDRIELW